MRWLAITMFCTCCAACNTTTIPNMNSVKEYTAGRMHRAHAAHANARVASGKKPSLKRGGRYVVGKPYVVKGKRYYPKEEPDYDRNGVASWYGSGFQGHLTANGETYDVSRLSAAHPTLPLPSYVRVANVENGSSVIFRVNDRGPYHKGRLIDVSSRAAEMLDLKHRGTAFVRVQYVGRAGLGGDDTAFLMASHVRKEQRTPAISRPLQAAAGALVVSQFLGAKLAKFAGNAPGAFDLEGKMAARAPQLRAMWPGIMGMAVDSRRSMIACGIEGKTSVRGETPVYPECCANEGREDRNVLQAFLPSGLNRRIRVTGTGGRRPRRGGDQEIPFGQASRRTANRRQLGE